MGTKKKRRGKRIRTVGLRGDEKKRKRKKKVREEGNYKSRA